MASMDYWEKYFGNAGSSPTFQVPPFEDEIEEFRSEKSVKTGKSPEEIKKYMVDESLSDLERACFLLSTGQDVQKLCALDHLPDLLKNEQMETLCRVIPKLCDMLPSASTEVQVLASRVLGEAVQQDLIPVHIFTSTCLPTVLSQMESRDQAVSKAWLGTILACIKVLPKEELRRKLVPLAVSKGQLSQTVSSRQASCRIVGEIATRFEPMWLKQELLPLATTLCQDVDCTVRELMCQQLSALGQALGPEVSEESVLPELVELLNDEEHRVRVYALESLVELLSLWSKQCRKTQVLPLLRGMCETAGKSDDWTLIKGPAKLIGRLCYEMKDVMSEDQFKWFLKCYLDMCNKEFPLPTKQPLGPGVSKGVDARMECRQLCAYNFPAMVVMVGKGSFKQELLPTLKSLASDPSWGVRRTIACGFNEVVHVLEDKAELVTQTYQALLKDESVEVLNGLVKSLPETLLAFASAANLTPETQQPGLFEFIGPLLAFEQLAVSIKQWRLHRDLVTSWKCLVNCLTSEQINAKFVPLILKYILGTYVLPVKQAASWTLCVFLRHNRRQEQRTELITWITGECGKSTSYRNRLMFLDICTHILDLFSRNFFKVHFFEIVLQLAHDPVSNIRLRLCQLFPALKSILKLPTDRVLLQNLELTVRKFISQERDPDVSRSIHEAITEMDRIEVAMETLTRRTFFEADFSDQQKEVFERSLVVAEEKDKLKQEKAAPASGGKKALVKGVGKPAPSPREPRKASLTIIQHTTSTNTASPSIAHKSLGKCSSNQLSSHHSSPSQSPGLASVSIGSTSPATSPSHAKGRVKRVTNSDSKSSPTTGDKLMRTISTTSSASKDTLSSLSVNKGGKKKQYGLEYSSTSTASKPKKRT